MLRRAILALPIVLMLVYPAALAATPVASPSRDLAPVLPRYWQTFGARLASMPRYQMQLELDDAASTLTGSMTVTFPNETGSALDFVPFRLYPNASYYEEGQTSIGRVSVDGIDVAPRFDDSGTVLFVDLSHPLPPGESRTVALDFSTVIPSNASGSFGILNHDIDAGRFVLADWYPVVAGWDSSGWRLEPPNEQGDPTFSTTSLYDVELTAPAGYEVFSTGDAAWLDGRTVRIESGPVREFALVLARGLDTRSALAGDTMVHIHVDPAHVEIGQHLLEVAVAALEFYNGTFGDYPFRELDIVETDLSLAYGVSWSGIVFVDETQLSLAADNVAALDFTVFHELGHQWWGAAIGADSNDHTFMVEGLTNATALLAQAAVQGPDAAASSLYAWMVTPYLNMLAGSGDAVVDVSIFDQPPTAPISTLAYGKGGLGFLAIRNEIGDAAFRTALGSYADRFRLGIAEPVDLLTEFEIASGRSLHDLWSLWFESARTTPADIEALVPQIIASLDQSEKH